jgi:hypothetical protein
MEEGREASLNGIEVQGAGSQKRPPLDLAQVARHGR